MDIFCDPAMLRTEPFFWIPPQGSPLPQGSTQKKILVFTCTIVSTTSCPGRLLCHAVGYHPCPRSPPPNMGNPHWVPSQAQGTAWSQNKKLGTLLLLLKFTPLEGYARTSREDLCGLVPEQKTRCNNVDV